jgi:hypothetical protein
LEVRAPKPRVSKKPMIVELALKEKRGKGLKPFVGEYRVVNQSGETVSNGTAERSGEPLVMILSPGEYEVRVPKKNFRHTLSLLGTEGDKKKVTVVVDR